MDGCGHIKRELFSTSIWCVLHFLLQNSDTELIDAEIASQLQGVKKSSVNTALRKLAKINFITRTPRGRMIFNKLNDTAYVKQLKIVSNLTELEGVVEGIKSNCSKIILFGSRAHGLNGSKSDYDLFCISIKPEKVQKAINQCSIAEKVQIIIKTPEEVLSFSGDEPVLNDEIGKGITIWEKK